MDVADWSRLEEIKALLLDASNAPSRHTVDSYIRRWKQWSAFAEFHKIDALPAKPEHVAAFVVARMNAGVSVSTIEANLSAVRWIHKRYGVDTEVTAPARNVLRALRDQAPNDSSQIPVSAATLSVGAIEAMAYWIPPGDQKFSTRIIRHITGLKPSQLVPAKASDVRFSPDGNTVILDLPSGGVGLIRGRHPLECPVRAMRSLVAASDGETIFTLEKLYKASPRGFDPTSDVGNEPVRLGIRDKALILTGYAGALRTVEIARLRVEDLTAEPWGYRLGIRHAKSAKPGETQYVKIERTHDALDPIQAIDDWLAVRGDHDGTLFNSISHTARKVSTHDEGMHPSTIRDLIVARGNAVGIDSSPSGHSLRRSWATHQWLRSPHAVATISVKLRHARLETTTRYIEDLRLDTQDSAHDLLDPSKVISVGAQKPNMRRTLGFAETPIEDLLAAVDSLSGTRRLKPNTRKKQAIGWQWWCRFALEHDLPIMPADPTHVAAFIAQRADNGISPSTLNGNLAAVRLAHVEYDMSPACGFKLAAEVIAGHQRTTAGQTEPVPTLTDKQLKDLARYLTRSGKELELAVVSLSYAGALRSKDIEDLRIEDVQRRETGLVISVRGSTGDTKSARVLCLARDDELDPVAAFNAQAGERTEGPLFPHSYRDRVDEPMGHEPIRYRLKRDCAKAGIDQKVTLQSFRKAWATHAYENGLDVLTITRHMRQGQNSRVIANIQQLSPWVNNAAQQVADTLDPTSERYRP